MHYAYQETASHDRDRMDGGIGFRGCRGAAKTTPKVPLVTRVLRWIQQILGGSIFLPG
jgi:hypothetical protein